MILPQSGGCCHFHGDTCSGEVLCGVPIAQNLGKKAASELCRVALGGRRCPKTRLVSLVNSFPSAPNDDCKCSTIFSSAQTILNEGNGAQNDFRRVNFHREGSSFQHWE
jgi:hypothetical protein